MPRRTKQQIVNEQMVSDACNRHAKGRVFVIWDLAKIAKAGNDAAANGQDIDAAVLAAAIKYDTATTTA